MNKHIILVSTFFSIIGIAAGSVADKVRDSQILIAAATKYLGKHTLAHACHAFTREVSWRKGDLVLSLVREDGTVIADALDPATTWDNMSHNPAFKRWLDQAAFVTRDGESGWTMHVFKNDIRAVYVQKIKKDGMNMYLSVGFYPENSAFETELIVNAAADYIEAAGSALAFPLINEPTAFVSGDIVAAVIGMDGKVHAYGQTDEGIKSAGLFSASVIKASETDDSGWIETTHNNATHKRYFQKVFDKKTQKDYLVTAGYYSDVTREKVYKIVTNAINTIKRADKQSFVESLRQHADLLVYGHSAVRVFNTKGDLIFDARAPQNTGSTNAPAGLTQEIIEAAKQRTTGWKAIIKKSTAYLVYYEYLEGYDKERYIVTAGFYPKDKGVTIQAVVNHGAFFFEQNTPEETFAAFTDPNSLFTLGDISLAVYSFDGICLVNNDRPELSWADLKSVTDQDGKFIVPSLQLVAKKFGSGWTSFTLSNATRRVYVRRVYSAVLESDIMQSPIKYAGYIVAAGYFV